VEIAILSAQHLSRFDKERRLATLVVFAREMEAILTDAGITMFDKMLGSVFRRAGYQHRERTVNRAKVLNASSRALLGIAKAMLTAKAAGTDPLAAVESTIGWQRLATLVGETETMLAGTREDNLSEVIGRYPVVRRIVPVLLGAFAFRSWKAVDPLLTALDLLRAVHAVGARKLPERVPTGFLTAVWRKLVGAGPAADRRAYEVAVMIALRDRLRAGDIWVEGSRAFRAFDAFLLPRAVLVARHQEGGLGLAVPDRFAEWQAERVATLEARRWEVAIEQMMAERGVSVDHSTIYRWVQRYAPEIEKRLRWHWRRPRSGSWRVEIAIAYAVAAIPAYRPEHDLAPEVAPFEVRHDPSPSIEPFHRGAPKGFATEPVRGCPAGQRKHDLAEEYLVSQEQTHETGAPL
jgi:hypothetical protein